VRVHATLGCLASKMPIPTIELSPFQPLFHLSCSSSAVFFVPFNFSWSFSAFPALYPASFAVHLTSSALRPPIFCSALHRSLVLFSFFCSFSVFPALRPSSSAVHSASLLLLLFRHSFLLLSNFSWTHSVFPALHPSSSALLPFSALHPFSCSSVFCSSFGLSCSSSAPLFPYLLAIQLLLVTFSLSCSSSPFLLYIQRLLLFIQPLLLLFRYFCLRFSFSGSLSAFAAFRRPFLLYIQRLLLFIQPLLLFFLLLFRLFCLLSNFS
jgi:hypothetical protein